MQPMDTSDNPNPPRFDMASIRWTGGLKATMQNAYTCHAWVAPDLGME